MGELLKVGSTILRSDGVMLTLVKILEPKNFGVEIGEEYPEIEEDKPYIITGKNLAHISDLAERVDPKAVYVFEKE